MEKSLLIRVSAPFKKAIKFVLANSGETQNAYLVGCIEADLLKRPEAVIKTLLDENTSVLANEEWRREHKQEVPHDAE